MELTLHTLRRHHMANHSGVARDGAEALALLVAEEDRLDPPSAPTRLEAAQTGRLASAQEAESRSSNRLHPRGHADLLVEPIDFKQFSLTIQQLGIYWLVANQPQPEAARGADRRSAPARPERGRA